VPIGNLAVISGMSVNITLERAGTISIQGNVNVLTERDAFIYVYLDGVQVGPPFYTSVANAWNNVPVFVMRNVPAGTHTITLRGSSEATARAGSRVLTVTAF
jgi:hypothetical protein